MTNNKIYEVADDRDQQLKLMVAWEYVQWAKLLKVRHESERGWQIRAPTRRGPDATRNPSRLSITYIQGMDFQGALTYSFQP